MTRLVRLRTPNLKPQQKSAVERFARSQPTFTDTEDGKVPAPGTPSGKFLQDDGTWADVPINGDITPNSVTATVNVSAGGDLIAGNDVTAGGDMVATGGVSGATVTATGAVTGGSVGYATGVGGAVTQLTSKATAVTLNKICGQITTNNAALAAAASIDFTLNNSTIAATDVVVLSIASGATIRSYSLTVQATATGSCSIQIYNHSSSSRSDAIVINFAVIKAVAS